MMQILTLSTGRKLAYEEFGDPKGLPCFYHHGWPSSRVQAVMMDGVGKEMGLRIVSADRPGMGDSDYHPGRRLLDWPQVQEELAAHLGWDRFHVVGVSGGGPYALVSAYAMPDRLLSVSVVCGAPPLHLLGAQDMFWVYRAVLQVRNRCPWLLGLIFRAGTIISYQTPSQMPMRWLLALLDAEDRAAMRKAATQQVVAEGFRQAVRRGVAPVMTDADVYLTDWGFDLSAITLPVHFWHGRRDRNIPVVYAEKIAARIPGAITHWFDEEGHYSICVNRCREVAEVMRVSQR